MPDLIDLARAKLAIPSATSTDDATLLTLIAAASAAIERYSSRSFAAADHVEILHGPADGQLLLTHFPIVRLRRVAIEQSTGIRLRNAIYASDQFPAPQVEVRPGMLVLRRWVVSSQVTTELPIASSTLLLTLASSINGLSGTGYEAELPVNRGIWPASYLVPIGPVPFRAQWMPLAIFSGEMTHYRRFDAEGRLEGAFPIGPRRVLVDYRAGFETIPEDIQQATAELVAHLFADRSLSKLARRERLGDYEIERLTQSATDRIPIVANGIAPYRDRRCV